jgi:hypothetical protein
MLSEKLYFDQPPFKMEKIWDDVGNFTWMCASNDVYILEFFQCTSQYSHLKYWN